MRVLIATATAGGGHVAAAAALAEVWGRLRPDDPLDTVDVVKFFSPLHRKIHADGYLTIVEHAPEIWGLMFNKTDNPKLASRLNRLRRVFPSKSRQLFGRHVQNFAPDVVLCTHYAPIETLGVLKAKAVKRREREARKSQRRLARDGGAGETRSPLVVSVVTDFEAHALWMAPCVDLYCVAADETRARLVARGASAENVVATGIPISQRFARRPEPHVVRKGMGLRDDQPVLLVLSGGYGTGPIGAILAALDRVERPFQTVVVTGHNDALRRELAPQDHRHPTHVIGFTSNMHELMAAADLIISKPGGLTTSELLALGKPIFVVNPIPGQEAANSDFLLEHGAAAKVNRLDDLPFRLEQLLGSRKLAAMARAAKALGRPQAAAAICNEVVKRRQP